MTNFEFIQTLSKKELAHIFAKIQLDSADESEWLNWMGKRAKKDEWEQILK